MSVSIKLILKNKIRNDGTYPIMLRVIKDRRVKMFSTGINCLENDWDGEKLKKTHSNHLKRNLILSNFKNKALKIIDDFVSDDIDFSLEDFSDRFIGDKNQIKINVYDFFKSRIVLMETSGRTGNARSYKDTFNSFFTFCKDKELTFRKLNVSLLENYEAYLRSRNNQDSGIAFRMRTIRAIYNAAIRNGVVKKEFYPFDKYKISKLKGKGIKRALSREEVKKILDVDVSERPDLIEAKNFFKFSYFTRGLNFIDLMKMKKENIQGDTITYIRSKTKGRFVIKILPPVQEVLDYYANNDNGTDYVFPILLKNKLTPKQIENRKHKALRKFNKDLKELASLAGVDKNVTSYVIRHSFATNLKQLGVSTDLISVSMGHSSLEVTKNYLKEFENEVIDEANEKLLKF
ncbi:MAG: site-specific integrase [Flavobacteriaceae bacterium]|nr:site-specific integrase [Flavobacteriaceae bacterium]